MRIRPLLLLGCLTSFVFAETPSGCLVGSVSKGTPAEAAGLRVGDIITEAGRQSVGSVEDLQRIIARAEESLDLVLLRESTRMDVHVVWPPESVDHRLGIRCGPVTTAPPVTAAEPDVMEDTSPFKAANAHCPYASLLQSAVKVTLADGSVIQGKLLSCDGHEIALRSGLLYRVFKMDKVNAVSAR